MTIRGLDPRHRRRGHERSVGVLPGGADAAVWAVLDQATRRTAAQVVATLDGRDTVVRLARRYADHGTPQRAGHLFEVMHAIGFNRHAARTGSAARAHVLEWAWDGAQNGPVDIVLTDGATKIARVQAKLLGRVAPTAHQISRSEYQGMTRLVAADRLEAVNDLLDRRLTMNPEGTFFADYADARAATSDRLAYDAVHSDPISYHQAQKAAGDPIGWANGQVAGAVARDVAAAGLAGAAAGALIGGLTATAMEAARVRAGQTSAGSAVITSAGCAARAAVRSGAVGGISAGGGRGPRPAGGAAARGGGSLPSVFLKKQADDHTTI
ncbi:hypothetical protein MXD95_007055, partial [Frankia sp. AiPa1]|nr:hypothetical protein [Frankia sp. AiPa1]